MLGAMASCPEKLDDRAIFYKHDASNFYPALSYVIGQAIASIPQMLIDVLLFGSFVYWLVGFVTSAKGFFLVNSRESVFAFSSGCCSLIRFCRGSRAIINERLHLFCIARSTSKSIWRSFSHST